MISYQDKLPTVKYAVERKIDKKFEVAFYDLSSVKQLSKEEQDGKEHTYYSVNKYILVLSNIKYIEDDFNKLLQLAKAHEETELAKVIRAKRDSLLTATDWTQCVDCQLSAEKKEQYRVYRQALRDIPEQAGFPYEVVFPKL